MKRLFTLLIFSVLLLAGNVFAQDSLQVQNKKQFRKGNRAMMGKMAKKQGIGFVDANGDGYNDNAPDDDGDGIPNGMDPDYTGGKMHHGNTGKGFIDADGDGINDNALDDDGDGIPNGQDPDFVRPMDGHGNKGNGHKGKKGQGSMRGSGNGAGMGTGSGSGQKGGKRGGK